MAINDLPARRRPRRLAALLALAAATLHGHTLALSSDSEQPVRLTADQAELDNASGVGIYRGDVVMTQGTLEVTGDIMRVYTGEDRRIDRVEVEGSPATYRQLPDGEQEYVRARAPRMEYYVSGPERIRLLDGATLWQGRNEFKGQTIVYDVAAERVEADSGSEGDRIEITLFPNDGDPESGGEDAPESQ